MDREINKVSGEHLSFKDKLMQQLRIHEGVEPKVYTDTTGHKTVGVGFNLERDDAEALLQHIGADFKDICTGKASLTPEQIDRLLFMELGDIILSAKSLIKNYNELGDVRQRVVLDMIFNLGHAGFSRFKGTIAHIEREEWKEASKHMLDSLWAKQVKGRSKVLASMMRTGKDVYDFKDS